MQASGNDYDQAVAAAQETFLEWRMLPRNQSMLVQANGDSRHEFVVAALDAGSGEGMEEIRLMNYEEGDLDL